mgnify:CR=1 FL=1
MKKMRVLVMAVVVGLAVTGCGSGSGKGQTEPAVSVQETETEKSADETGDLTKAGSQAESAETSTAVTEENGTAGYKDNFDVDSAAAQAFAEKVQAAVADRDLEALADLTAFPVYVGLPEVDGGVESREEFINLGADQVFTPELVASVAAADLSDLSPSMAGFVLSDGGSANIIFGVSGGVLAIKGINY